MQWINLAQERDRGRAIGNTVKCWDIFNSSLTGGFTRTQHRGVSYEFFRDLELLVNEEKNRQYLTTFLYILGK